MRTFLFPVKRIMTRKLRSQRGASLVFALVGFMFAAMISFVVINAAYSAASRVKKLKNDEQTFLLAQSMSAIIIDALAGSGKDALLPDNTPIKTPGEGNLKYDGLTLGYQYIEQKNVVDGSIYRFYSDYDFYETSKEEAQFILGAGTGESKKTFSALNGKSSLSSAETAVQNAIRAMAISIDQESPPPVTETIVISYENFNVKTEFTMDRSYSIKAVITANVDAPSDGNDSEYVVRMDAGATVRTDKLICSGIRSLDNSTITATFTDKVADGVGEELVKISCYSVSWPPDQITTVYYDAP